MEENSRVSAPEALDRGPKNMRRRRRPKKRKVAPQDDETDLFSDIRIRPIEVVDTKKPLVVGSSIQKKAPSKPRMPPPRSILSLLLDRQMLGSSSAGKRQPASLRGRHREFSWTSRALKQLSAKRTIKFTELGTSANTAVLGLDRTGSFLIALGPATAAPVDEHDEDDNSLALQLYGIPSPAFPVRRPPVLLSVPLEFSAISSEENDENNWFVRPSPVQTPVRIWLAGDLGVCMYRDTATGSSSGVSQARTAFYCASVGFSRLF